jgi:hypothetical protein
MGLVEKINTWITDHLTLVVSVGVPVLTVLVTLLVSYLTITASTKAQSRQRKLEHQLKLADFRQAWIDDMRTDLALYTARTWSASLNEGIDAEKERVMAQARILMRMNPNDPDYDAIKKSLGNPVANLEAGRKALFQIGQGILKREWERLKADLNAVDGK